MGSGHGHDGIVLTDPLRRRRANILLSVLLIPVALAALVGTIWLWPGPAADRVSLGDPYGTSTGVSMRTGTVERTEPGICPSSQGLDDVGGRELTCNLTYVVPATGGVAVALEVPPEILAARDLRPGDRVRFLDLSAASNAMAAPYIFVDFVRTAPVLLLAALYALVVCLVARWRGARAILGLIGGFCFIAYFMLPALLEGRPPLLVGLVGSVVIMFGALYFAHGFSARTSTALLGTLFGLGVTAALAIWATDAAYLTGATGEESYLLGSAAPELSLSGLLVCGLLIAGLGVLNDVTITQSSAVWELAEISPGSSSRELFTSAMRIGRDHIASTVYTIAFAYAGAALPVLILVGMYDRPLLDSLTGGELAEEVVRILVGSIGLVLSIPVTTAVAVAVVKAVGPGASASPTRQGRRGRRSVTSSTTS
ncbi:YibE/F family protein [Paeniglutamicibacter cryotolerans]|uniref:Putative membrane protein n=1 Tax=Paeniglutamicibacter cryotolerans TaxID=670079 RepID=A0A839QDS8_9MICC|nr:YibE/F family protein [Paeniglutamicibacter cryotolerans]MBB2994368.1 putative membrane protein [Paeniglutamicibacter cryotolerans]